jgi:tRNA-dihydrouridine synthase B
MKNFWKKIHKPILALAPMAGITDSAFRQICKKYGADITYSEMASASALYFKPAKTLRLVKFNKSERPYVVQLFGKNPEHFAKAARILSSLPLEKGDARRAEGFNKHNIKSPSIPLFQRGRLSRPDGIDINFGCPAKKVFGHGSGCALMGNIKLAREIIQAVCKNTNLPVSIKIRAGLRKTSAIKFIKKTRDLPYSAVMIHGRTYESSFSGPVDFSICEEIKKIAQNKIILGNGGVNSAEDAVKILRDYPLLDGLGIARGAWGRPWIFDEIRNLLKIYPVEYAAKRRPPLAEFNRVKKIMIKHAKLIYKDKQELGMFEIRKHLCWYIKGFPGAADLRKKLVLTKSVEEISVILSGMKSL